MPENSQIRVITDHSQPGWSELKLSGRVTVATAKSLHEAMLKLFNNQAHVRVSCADVEYLDVSAIQLLVCLGREVTRQGKKCDITKVPDPVVDLLRLAGV